MSAHGNRRRPATANQASDAFGQFRKLVGGSSGLRLLVAAVWFTVIGLLLAGGAVLLGQSPEEALQIGLLGGIGAAAYILVFAGST